MPYKTVERQVRRSFFERLFSFHWFTPTKVILEKEWFYQPPPRGRSSIRVKAPGPHSTEGIPQRIHLTPPAPVPRQKEDDSDTSFLIGAAVGYIASEIFSSPPAPEPAPAPDFNSGGGGDFGGGGSSGDW